MLANVPGATSELGFPATVTFPYLVFDDIGDDFSAGSKSTTHLVPEL
jgi:hypothetical protein